MADKKKIGKREVDGLQPGESLWDAKVTGFGIRRQNSPAVAYVLLYRTKEGRLRRYTIGRHGAPWTPDEARDEAIRILGQVKAGKDPAADKTSTRKAVTVSDLCDLYMRDAEAGRLLTRRRSPKKASTLEIDKGRIARHIKPLLGHLKVAAVTSRDVENFMNNIADGKTAGSTKTAKKRGLARVRGGKGAATRAVGFLGGVFTYSIQQRMRADNPVRGVIRFKDGERNRRMKDEEYRMLGDAVTRAAAEHIWPAAVAVVRFLAITGWRKGEALNLHWREVDIKQRTATLSDTKTGKSLRPLSLAACDLLNTMARNREDDLVFPASRGDRPMAGFAKIWGKIAALGRLPKDITPHVLRHSLSSLANDLGYSEPTIAAMVGHKGKSMTSRYIHSADNVLLAAADTVANKTLKLMGEGNPTAKVLLLRGSKHKFI